jgi:hypothetical protein
VFAGLAPADQVAAFLAGTDHATVLDFGDGPTYQLHRGGPIAAPATAIDWAAQTSGTGTQSLSWSPQAGDWAVVVMNADATPGVSVRMDVGATAPGLGPLAVGLLATGALGLAGAAALVGIALYLGLRRPVRQTFPDPGWEAGSR